jgi:hypothetical protein
MLVDMTLTEREGLQEIASAMFVITEKQLVGTETKLKKAAATCVEAVTTEGIGKR